MPHDDIVISSVGQRDGTALLVGPAEPGDRALLLLPMITGIGSRVREFAHEFAGAGFTTLCWDPFGGASTDTHGVEELRERRDRFDDREVLADQAALLDELRDRGAQRIGVVGYCLGGRFALLLAADEDRVDATVAYHPTVPEVPEPNHSLDPFTAAQRIRGPVLVHYPGRDHLVPSACLNRLEAELRGREHAATAVHHYPEAEHGFSDSSRHHVEANRAAYRLAVPQTLAFLAAALE